MKMYRVLTSESHWDDKHILYGIELHVENTEVRGHKNFGEVVFEAEDDATANRILEYYAESLRKTGGKWSATLQRVRVNNGVVRRIRTLRTIIGPQKNS